MSMKERSVSRRHQEARARWAGHLSTQPESGQNQVNYCRAHGLDPKSFSLWKRKLHEPGKTDTVRMVPLIVTRPGASTIGSASRPTAVSLRLALGNGLLVSLEVALNDLSVVLGELAAVRC